MASNINMSTNSGRKMPILVPCFKCKKLVDIKSTAMCSICKNRFEPDCDGYPEQTYRLMNQESRKNWKCKACIQKSHKSKKVPSSSDLSNITKRKKNNTILEPILTSIETAQPITEQPINENKSIDAIQPTTQDTSNIIDSQLFTDSETSYELYDIPNIMSKSMDCTITDQLCISEMKEQIAILTSKLETTESELDNIILENNNLNRQIQMLNEEVKLLKSLCKSSTIIGNSPYKSDNRRHSLPRRKRSPTNSPLSSNSNLQPRDIAASSQQEKIALLQQQLEDIQRENTSLTKQIESLTQSELKMPIERERQHKANGPLTLNTKRSDHSLKKLCLISSNKTNNVLSIALDTFGDMQLCHYLSPKHGILHMIKNLHEKLYSFTKNDYCVILIGEDDFKTTNNYSNLILELRDTLLKIRHTNLILCLPTYKCCNYATVFNCRVEMFGILLSLDVNSYHYATLVDSNRNLSIDGTMFSKYDGRLNNNGMRTIFNDILLTMKNHIAANSTYQQITSGEINLASDQNFIHRIDTDFMNESSKEHNESECNKSENLVSNNLFRL